VKKEITETKIRLENFVGKNFNQNSQINGILLGYIGTGKTSLIKNFCMTFDETLRGTS